MFTYGVSCAFEELPAQQPTTIRGDIQNLTDRAKRFGYDALELFIRNPKQYDGKALRTAVDAAGLRFCGITNGMEYMENALSFISDDKAVRDAAFVRFCEHIDLGEQLGSPVIVGMMRGNIPDFSRYTEYEDRLYKIIMILQRKASCIR